MSLFDIKHYYWVIKDGNGHYWSTRDQCWMGFTRATLYDSEDKARKVMESVSFMLKVNMEIHNPYISKISVEEC